MNELYATFQGRSLSDLFFNYEKSRYNGLWTKDAGSFQQAYSGPSDDEIRAAVIEDAAGFLENASDTNATPENLADDFLKRL